MSYEEFAGEAEDSNAQAFGSSDATTPQDSSADEPVDSGNDTGNTSNNAPVSDPMPTGSASEDQSAVASAAVSTAVDDQILSHEGVVQRGKDIASTAVRDRDAARSQDDSGENNSDGSSSGGGSGRSVLKINGEVLENLRRSATYVSDEFGGSAMKTEKARNREAVAGFHDLSKQIKSFYDNWSACRDNITEVVKTYAGWMRDIDEGFSNADRDLAAKLHDFGAFDNDPYEAIRQQQAEAAPSTPTAPNLVMGSASLGRMEEAVENATAASPIHFEAPARSREEIVSEIGWIEGRSLYARYVASFLAGASGFGTTTGMIGQSTGQEAVAAEGIEAFTRLLVSARDSAELPAELGFLSVFDKLASSGGAEVEEATDAPATTSDTEEA